MFAGSYAIRGWAICNGALLPIAQYQSLYQLIGASYGGDGQTTFAIPDLRSRVPVHMGTGSTGTVYQLAAMGGLEAVTLNISQIPLHSHPPLCAGVVGSSPSPTAGFWAIDAGTKRYFPTAPGGLMAAGAIGQTGGATPSHSNISPYLAVNFLIALSGLYPQAA